MAVDDRYSVEEDDPLRDSASRGVLANDSDPDGDPLEARVLTGPSHGTLLRWNPDGSFWYRCTDDDDFEGTDSFTYEVSDDRGGTATATVFIRVED